jgi:type IV pilus assembly protein PilN
MIRINLLGVPKAKRGKRPTVAAPAALSSEGVNPLLIALVVLVLTALANGGYWWKLNHDAQKIAAEMKKAEQENRELLQVKARVDQKNRQAEAYQRRVQVIDKLREGQSGPKALLTMLGDTISNTDAVWLSKVNDDGAAITMQGTALSANAVANLISNLQKTGYFKSVEMKETYQDDAVRNMQAFTFNLVCTKKS